MFDYVVAENVKCPHCKKTTTFELQTKAGQKVLYRYILGEKFEFNDEYLEMEVKGIKYHSRPKYLIILMGRCIKCDCHLEGCCWIGPKSRVMEEIEIWNYTISIEPKIIIKWE